MNPLVLNLAKVRSTILTVLLALLMAPSNLQADFPDPQGELEKLSQAERTIINARCRASQMSLSDYRECIWDQLEPLAPQLANDQAGNSSYTEQQTFPEQSQQGQIDAEIMLLSNEHQDDHEIHPDPDDHISELSSAEQLLISARCPAFQMSVADYRSCVWDELGTIEASPVDPQREIESLSHSEQLSIMANCPSVRMTIPDYRRCVWSELAGIGLREPVPQLENVTLGDDIMVREKPQGAVEARSVFAALFGVLIGVCVIMLALVIYLAPALIARQRKHPNATMILLLNLFLGGTGFVWLVLLLWAYSGGSRQSPA